MSATTASAPAGEPVDGVWWTGATAAASRPDAEPVPPGVPGGAVLLVTWGAVVLEPPATVDVGVDLAPTAVLGGLPPVEALPAAGRPVVAGEPPDAAVVVVVASRHGPDAAARGGFSEALSRPATNRHPSTPPGAT